jgi:hypothetical protein
MDVGTCTTAIHLKSDAKMTQTHGYVIPILDRPLNASYSLYHPILVIFTPFHHHHHCLQQHTFINCASSQWPNQDALQHPDTVQDNTRNLPSLATTPSKPSHPKIQPHRHTNVAPRATKINPRHLLQNAIQIPLPSSAQVLLQRQAAGLLSRGHRGRLR